MANVPLSEDVPKIYVPSLSVPHLSTPHLQAPQLATPGKSTYVKPERRHVKDLGDLLLGDPIKGTKQLRHALKDAGYYRYLNVPVLNRLVGFSVMSKERFLDPISEGEWGVAFVNSLETLGGSLDIVANPVKALLPWAGGGSSTDLLKSMGWIEDEYRETYQWDTGNWLVDLIGEIISDPINWFTFGSNTAMKGAAGVTDDVARAAIKELPEEALSTRTVTNLLDDFAQHVGDDGTKIVENYITKQKNQIDDLHKQLSKSNLTRGQRNKLIQQTTALQDEVDELGYLMDTLTTDQQAKLFSRLGILGNEADVAAIEYGYRSISPKQREAFIQKLVDASQSKGYRTYEFWRNVNKFAKGADDLLMKAAIYTTLPFGLSKIAYDYLAKPLFRALWTKTVLALENADLFKNASKGNVEHVKQIMLRETNAAYQRTVKDWDEYLKARNYSVEKARKLWLNIYKEMADTVTDINIINARFIEELIKQAPELRYVADAPAQLAAKVLNDAIDPDVAAHFAKQLSIEDFTEYCSTSGIINYYIDTQAVGVVRDRMARDVKNFWSNKHKGYKIIDEALTYAELDPVDVIMYIDEGLLRTWGGLKGLDEMLTQLSKQNPKAYQSYLALFNYIGLTLDNYTRVKKLLTQLKTYQPDSKEYKKAYASLKGLLTKSKTGDLLILDAVEQNKKVFNKQIEEVAKKKTNVADSNEVIQQLTYAQEHGWRWVEGAQLDEQGNIPTEKVVTNTKKTYELNLTGLQDDLDTLIKVTNFEGPTDVHKQLDEVFNYAGTYDYQYDVGIDTDVAVESYAPSSLSFSEALTSLHDKASAFAKELKSTNITDPDDIIQKHSDFINELRVMRDAVHKAQYAVNKEITETAGMTTKYSLEVRNLLNDLESLLKDITDTGITNMTVADIKTIAQTAYEEGTDVLYSQMSKENMLGFIGDILNKELIDDELWQALSDPNTHLRENLLLLASHLERNADTLNYVADIKDILSTIDTINLYREIMSYEFCHIPGVPDTVLDYVRGEFFNRIYAAARYKQPQFEKAVTEIIDTFKLNLYKQRDVYDWFKQMNFDEAMQKAILDDITTSFKYNLDEYVKGLDRIRINNNLPSISFFKNYNNTHLVQKMHNLGWGYEAIMKQLIESDPTLLTNNAQALVDIGHFITGISARVSTEVRESVNDIIANQALTMKGVQKQYLIDNLKYLHGSALATRLEQAFSDIAKYNGELQRRAGIIGTVEGEKVFNIMGYMLKRDINEALRLTSDATNAYVYSSLGGVGFKQFISYEELNKFQLAPKFFQTSATNEEYTMFIKHWQNGYKRIQDRVFASDAEYIAQLRDNLIDAYTKMGSEPMYKNFVIPKDPRTYFRNMSNEELLVWDYITSKSSYNSRMASRYVEIKRHRVLPVDFDLKAEHRMNPLSVVNSYEEATDMVTQSEAMASILVQTDLEHLDLQVECLQEDVRKQIKDLETLGVHRDTIVNLINQDADAISGISNLQDLLEDTRKVSDVVDLDSLDEYTKEQLARFFGTEHFGDLQLNDKRVQNYLKAEIYWDQYESVKSLDAVQLRAYIDNECSGELFISNPKYDLDYDWNARFTKEELAQAGLKVWQDPEEPTHFIIRRVDNNITKASYTFKQHDSLFPEQRSHCFKVIEKAQHYYYNDGMSLPYELYSGDTVSENAVKTIKKSDRYAKAFGDLEEQKLYSNLDEKGSNKFFQKNIPRPNAMFIGDPNCYNDFMGTVADAFKSTEEAFIPKTLDLPRSVATGVVQSVKMVNTQHKLMSLVANDDFYIGNEMFRPIFEKASDKELKQFFKDNGFVACVVKQNTLGQPRIYKIYIDNQKTLAQAIENKALILPYEVYRSMVLGINKGQTNSKLLNIYTRYIAGTYKSIWLTTPGFIMRNAIDSMLYKNMASTNGIMGLFDVIKYEHKAAKILDWYDNIYIKAIELRKADGGFATPNMQYIRKVLKDMSEDDKQMFLLMLAFEKSGGSASLTETVEQALLKYNKAMTKGVDYVDDTIIDLLYKNSPVGWVNKINDRVERISRLGLLLNLMDNGVSKSDAFKRVIDTHFDYELAEAELGLLGQIFWFITFPIKNSLYYLNEGLTRNPEMLKIQMDMLEQSWNSGDITWDDVRHSDYLMYNAMAGNIRFTFNGKNIVLKTGSSVLDFFKVLYNPVDAAKERLNPFLSVLLGFEEPSQLNPLSSVSNRIDQVRAGRSLIPSVYTTLYDRKYKKKHYIERKPYVFKSKWRFKPRKTYIKKPSLSRYTSYKFMTNRYYFNKGKNLNFWLTQTNSIQPHWYMNSYRYRKTRNKYSIKPITNASR